MVHKKSIQSVVQNKRIVKAEEKEEGQLQVIQHVLKIMQMATNKQKHSMNIKIGLYSLREVLEIILKLSRNSKKIFYCQLNSQ